MTRCPACGKDFSEAQVREMSYPDAAALCCPHCAEAVHYRCLQCDTEFFLDDLCATNSPDGTTFKCPVCDCLVGGI